MKKRIAIVTGASGGLGKEFVAIMVNEEIDEIWCVARNTQKLNMLKEEYGNKVVPLSFDLSEPESINSIKILLEKEHPVITYLINNTGIGENLSPFKEFSLEKINNIIQINCNTVVSLCAVCIPFMQEGSRILNISSQSSFQPVPYLNLYAATKVFVRSFTRALNFELKEAGIFATAVCPGWIDTEMLPKTLNGKKIKYPGLVSPKRVAAEALSDAKKKKDMSVCTLYVKYMHLLSKIFPQKTIMKNWVKNIQNLLENKES